MTERERAEAFKREAHELQDELRPLVARERRGELDFTEEQRVTYCRERLAEIRSATSGKPEDWPRPGPLQPLGARLSVSQGAGRVR